MATRSTLPITGHVLIATEGGRLKLSATNLEIALTCWIGAQIEEEGRDHDTGPPAHRLRQLAAHGEAST